MKEWSRGGREGENLQRRGIYFVRGNKFFHISSFPGKVYFFLIKVVWKDGKMLGTDFFFLIL
jgi:hypothetical protein